MPDSKAPSSTPQVSRLSTAMFTLSSHSMANRLLSSPARLAGWRQDEAVGERSGWPDVPGQWLRDRAVERTWKRVGTFGMNFVMAVRDYRELAQGSFELVPFDQEFDMARAVKSEEELVEVRDAMDIVVDGFWALIASYKPGKTEAEIMAPAVERFFARGAGPRMMNILLSGEHGEANAFFKVPGHRKVAGDDLLLYSLEVTGADIGWSFLAR
jgi:Xaa-Pro aminopeptidase